MYAIFTEDADVEIRIKKSLEEALKERSTMKVWLGEQYNIQIVELTGNPIDPKILEDHDNMVKYKRHHKKTSIEPSIVKAAL